MTGEGLSPIAEKGGFAHRRLAIAAVTAVAAWGVSGEGPRLIPDASAQMRPGGECEYDPTSGMDICRTDPEPEESSQEQEQSEESKPVRQVSYNQCGWGHNGCAAGCGVAAAANMATDLTGYTLRPRRILKLVGTSYYGDTGQGGTAWSGFTKVAEHYNITENKTADLKDAKKIITKYGGVAVILVQDSLAVKRSGRHSKIAMSGHYVTLDGYKNGGFTMVDSNKGKDREGNPRRNERLSNGKRRVWTEYQLRQNGLEEVRTYRRSPDTPLAPQYR